MKLPKTIKSRWGGNHGRCRLHLLDQRFGDGQHLVLLSFYAAPELAIAVRWDSKLPLDLSESERYKDYEGVKSFRDVTEKIYDALEEQFPRPPVGHYRRRALLEEIDEVERLANEQTKDEAIWCLILNNGSTWCDL